MRRAYRPLSAAPATSSCATWRRPNVRSLLPVEHLRRKLGPVGEGRRAEAGQRVDSSPSHAVIVVVRFDESIRKARGVAREAIPAPAPHATGRSRHRFRVPQFGGMRPNRDRLQAPSRHVALNVVTEWSRAGRWRHRSASSAGGRSVVGQNTTPQQVCIVRPAVQAAQPGSDRGVGTPPMYDLDDGYQRMPMDTKTVTRIMKGAACARWTPLS